MSGWVCGVCGSGNGPQQVLCWICGSQGAVATPDAPVQAPAQGAAQPPTAPAQTAGEHEGFMAPGAGVGYGVRLTAWLVLTLLIMFLSLLVGAEIAQEWPGLLIPYSLLLLVGGVGMAATIRLHLSSVRKNRHRSLVTVLDVVLGATAGAMAGTIVVLTVLLVVVLVIFVLLFLLCLGLLGLGSTGLH